MFDIIKFVEHQCLCNVVECDDGIQKCIYFMGNGVQILTKIMNNESNLEQFTLWMKIWNVSDEWIDERERENKTKQSFTIPLFFLSIFLRACTLML